MYKQMLQIAERKLDIIQDVLKDSEETLKKDEENEERIKDLQTQNKENKSLMEQ